MSKIIAYTKPDGSVAVCYPVVSCDDPPGFTAADALARALAKDVRRAASGVDVIDKSAIPSDRTFRDAWTLAGGKVGHDMEKARGIHLARLRAERNAKLAETDALMARAVETGNETERAALADLRQRLRDMPATVAGDLAAAQTPEELKAVAPAVLAEAGQRKKRDG